MFNEEKEENSKSRDLKYRAISNLKDNINNQKRKIYENNIKNLEAYYKMSRRIEPYRDTLKEIEDDDIRKKMTELLGVFDNTLNGYEYSFNQIAEENENLLNKLQAELERIVLTFKK